MPAKEKDINGDDTVLVLVSGNQIYVEMVKNALEEEGIPVLMKSSAGFYLRGMIPLEQDFFDFRLYVKKEQSERAFEIVQMIIPSEEA